MDWNGDGKCDEQDDAIYINVFRSDDDDEESE